MLIYASHFLVGFFFVFFGFWNIYHRKMIIELMQGKRIPVAPFVLLIGIVWQITAGAMLILNIFPQLAALALIPFTLIAICTFHNFWKFVGQLWTLNFTIFATNLTVTLGALLLIAATPTPVL